VSRPRREFKIDQRSKKKVIGRPRKVEDQRAKRVNWFQPVIWSGIEEAAKRAGKPWNCAEIVRQAKIINPQVYKTLTRQVLARWVDKDRGSAWKTTILAQVANGNSPGGESTRFGILVMSKISARKFLLMHK
jgi:hypothetical protein